MAGAGQPVPVKIYMLFLDPSKYTDFQREVVEKVTAGLPALLAVYEDVSPGQTPKLRPQSLVTYLPLRWGCNDDRLHLIATSAAGNDYYVCADRMWSDHYGKTHPPLGNMYHIHARCEVRARVNGVYGWTQLGALDSFERYNHDLLDNALSRTLEHGWSDDWSKAPHDVVLYTELDGLVGAIVDEAGDVEYDNSHTYENTANGWKEIE